MKVEREGKNHLWLRSCCPSEDGVPCEEDKQRDKTDESKDKKVSDHERRQCSQNDGLMTPNVRIFERLLEMRWITNGEQPILTQEEPDAEKCRHQTIDEHVPVITVRGGFFIVQKFLL